MLEEVKKRGVQVHHPARTLSLGADGNNQLSSIRISINGAEKERRSISSERSALQS
jgi:hypothetical protein